MTECNVDIINLQFILHITTGITDEPYHPVNI
jgi:hypothetical protein